MCFFTDSFGFVVVESFVSTRENRTLLTHVPAVSCIFVVGVELFALRVAIVGAVEPLPLDSDSDQPIGGDDWYDIN